MTLLAWRQACEATEDIASTSRRLRVDIAPYCGIQPPALYRCAAEAITGQPHLKLAVRSELGVSRTRRRHDIEDAAQRETRGIQPSRGLGGVTGGPVAAIGAKSRSSRLAGYVRPR